MTYDPTTTGLSDTSNIREHMEVLGSDGGHVGRVDHVKGSQIELAKLDLGTGLQHRYLPTDLVQRVEEDKVFLSVTKDEAKDRWTTRD